MKNLKNIFFILVIFVMLAACTPAQPAAPAETEPPAAAEKMTYCYITPGPDTWYKRDVEGFQFGAGLDGVEMFVI